MEEKEKENLWVLKDGQNQLSSFTTRWWNTISHGGTVFHYQCVCVCMCVCWCVCVCVCVCVRACPASVFSKLQQKSPWRDDLTLSLIWLLFLDQNGSKWYQVASTIQYTEIMIQYIMIYPSLGYCLCSDMCKKDVCGIEPQITQSLPHNLPHNSTAL